MKYYLSRGVGSSWSEVKLELKKWPKRVARTCRAVLDLPGQKSNWNWRSGLRANRAKKSVARTCRAVLDLPGQKSNWNWRTGRRSLEYPGGLVISPYFTILFFSNSPPLIFSNFNKFPFLSVYFLFLWVDVLSIRVYDRIYWIGFSVYENFHFGLLPLLLPNFVGPQIQFFFTALFIAFL